MTEKKKKKKNQLSLFYIADQSGAKIKHTSMLYNP